MTDNALKIIKDEIDGLNKLNTDRTIFGTEYAIDEEKERLSKALSVAVSALKKYSDSGMQNTAGTCITTIANILSGGKDGK